MGASYHGHHDIVRTLLEAKADVNAQYKVRNQNDDDNDDNTINYLDDAADDCYRCVYVNNR
jgi:hypothetical protein